MSSGVHCGIVERAFVVGVGGADVRERELTVAAFAPGHHEHRSAVLGDRDHRGDLVADQLPRDRDVDALGRANRVGMLALVDGAHVVGPDPGRVHDTAGADLEFGVARVGRAPT